MLRWCHYFLLWPHPLILYNRMYPAFIKLCLSFRFIHSFNPPLICSRMRLRVSTCVTFCTFPHVCFHVVRRADGALGSSLLSGWRKWRWWDTRCHVRHTSRRRCTDEMDTTRFTCKSVWHRLDLSPITLKHFARQNNPHSNTEGIKRFSIFSCFSWKSQILKWRSLIAAH